MKNTILIVVLYLTSSLIIAQSSDDKTLQEELNQYLDEQVVPGLTSQLEQFLKVLTADEKASIDNYKQQLGQLHQNRTRSKRGEGRDEKTGRNQNLSKNQEMRKEVEALYAGVNDIAQKHKEAVSSYQDFIGQNKGVWLENINSIMEEAVAEQQKYERRTERMKHVFNKMDDPAWLLLWNPDQPILRNQRKGIKEGQKRERSDDSQELRIEMMNYYTDNVFPVVAAERASFEPNLSSDERAVVEEARSESNRKRGAGLSAGRGIDGKKEMRKQQLAGVKEIAGKHEQEIEKSLQHIQSNMEKWKADLGEIALKHDVSEDELTDRMSGRLLERLNKPVGFLLFDPDKKPDYPASGAGTEAGLKVTLFPNPADMNTHIRLENLNSGATIVSLYTKEGEMMQNVFSGTLDEETLELKISTIDFEDGIYFVKVDADGITLTNKLIVQH